LEQNSSLHISSKKIPTWVLFSSSRPAAQSWKVARQMKCKKVNQFISANIKTHYYYIGQIFPHMQQATHSIFNLEDLFPIMEDKMKKYRS